MAKCRNCSSTSATATAPLISSQAGSMLRRPKRCARPLLSGFAAPRRLAVAPLATSPSLLAGEKSLQLPGPSAMLEWGVSLGEESHSAPRTSWAAWSCPTVLLRFASPARLNSLREHKHEKKQCPTFCSGISWSLDSSLSSSDAAAQPPAVSTALPL